MRLRTLGTAGLLAAVMLVVVLSSCRSQNAVGNGGLVIFHKSTYESIFPETRPTAGEITQQLRIQATPGEFETTSFGVLPQRDITNATLQVGDLHSQGGGIIPASAIDPRVVQVWEQKDIRGKSFQRVRVAEGLLKDDSLNLLSPQWTESNLPSIPPDAPIRTDLRRGQSKEFFLIVHVPDDAAAGDYTGTIRVGDMASPATVSLTVRVLPFKLQGPGKIIGMYYNDNISDTVPLSVYRARLRIMRNMGVDSLRILANRDTLEQELKEIKAAGFTGPIIVWDRTAFFGPKGLRDMRFYVDALKGAGYEPYIYGMDEPNVANIPPRRPHSMNGEIIAFKRIKQVGGLACTALSVITDRILINQYNQVLDFPLFNTSNIQGFKPYVAQIDANPAAKLQKLEGYYFGTWAENPRRNRLMAGFYLYNSHMDAAFGWTFYSYHMKGVGQPFNDFDLPPNKKRWMTVFPTKEGAAPTLQSEAFREGVDDLRYLNTFLVLAAQKEKEVGPAAVAPLLQQVQAEVARYRNMGNNKPEMLTATQYPFQQFDESRALIAQDIIKLMALRG